MAAVYIGMFIAICFGFILWNFKRSASQWKNDEISRRGLEREEYRMYESN